MTAPKPVRPEPVFPTLLSKSKILLIGANGQIGTELAAELARRHGNAAIVTSDVAPQGRVPGLAHEALDCTDIGALTTLVERHAISQVYHLAAALSARGELVVTTSDGATRSTIRRRVATGKNA